MIPIADAGVPRGRRPVVNIALIAINVVVFLYELSLNDFETFRFTYQFGVVPSELTSGAELLLIPVLTPIGLIKVDVASPIHPWGTVFTSMFIHGGWMHIIGNMLFLWVFGDNIEDRLGHVKYLLFYIVAGIAAVWTQAAIDIDSRTPLIGASSFSTDLAPSVRLRRAPESPTWHTSEGSCGVLIMAVYLLGEAPFVHCGYDLHLITFPYNRITTLVVFIFITGDYRGCVAHRRDGLHPGRHGQGTLPGLPAQLPFVRQLDRVSRESLGSRGGTRRRAVDHRFHHARPSGHGRGTSTAIPASGACCWLSLRCPGCARAGRTPLGRRPLPETVGRLHGQLTVRADSGFYAHALVAVCREMDVRFSITIRQHTRLRNLIEAIPEADWRPILDGRRSRRGRDHLQSLSE